MELKLDYSQMDELKTAMDNYEGAAGTVVDEYLHGEGYDLISESITRLVPASGRSWKGKATGARAAGAKTIFSAEPISLGVIVRTRNKYGYLYFPDDGSTTRRHRGNQQFMRRGAEEAAPAILTEICSRLIKQYEEA